MFCVNCGANMPDDSRFCQSCGVDQAVSAAPPFAPPPSSAPPASSRLRSPALLQSGEAQGIDLRRLTARDIAVGASSLLVFVSLFLPWYSNLNGDGSIATYAGALSSSAGGFRYLILVLSLLTVGYLLAKTMWRGQSRLPLPEWQLLIGLTGLNLLLVVLAFLQAPQYFSPGAGGAALGLIMGVLATVASGLGRRPSEVAPKAPRPVMGRAAAPDPIMPLVSATPEQNAVSGGLQVPKAPLTQEPEPAVCRVCGVQLASGNRFCTGCGSSVS